MRYPGSTFIYRYERVITRAVCSMAKSLSDLRHMQRNQLMRVNKEEIIDIILAEPERDDGQLRTLTDTLHTLVTEVTDLRKAVTAPDSVINKKFDDLQTQIDKQAEIIDRQQRFLESLDRKEREKNLIILGVPEVETSLEGVTTDEQKIDKIWMKIGHDRNTITSHRRLGNRDGNGNRARPILLTVITREAKDNVLEKAKLLKSSGDVYKRIYIKKDVHPSIRLEWKRLREVEKREKDRPENMGCTIRLDTKERKVYRDDVIIDAWKQPYF